MTVRDIETMASEVAEDLYRQFIRDTSRIVKYDGAGDLQGDFNQIFLHYGLYAFRVSRGERVAIAYVGKSESDGRLRQHLTGKNKDGTKIADSVRTKHSEIREAIDDGFLVHVCLCSNPDFGEASLACLEIATALRARSHFQSVFPGRKHWNKRIG